MDEFIKLVTFVGAVIAALTGLQSFFWQFLDRRDRIIVKSETISPPISPGIGLFVVNKSKHRIEIHDYGFILRNGLLFSLPDYFANEGVQNQSQAIFEGSSTPEPRERFEVYVDLVNLETVGAYAQTTTQRHPTLGFRYDLNFFQTMLARMRVRLARRR